MSDLAHIKIAIIGASRGLGRTLVETFNSQGAEVLAVARDRDALNTLAIEFTAIKTLALDASGAGAPGLIRAALEPDILVICGGALPPTKALHEMDWETFSTNWNQDVKMTFALVTDVLKRPLNPGSTVVIITSGAGLGGSPISGGYAGAKRMQMFLAAYAQKESSRANLDLRFLSLAPSRIYARNKPGQGCRCWVFGLAWYHSRSFPG